MKVKKITAAAVAAALTLSGISALAGSDVRVYVNGERVEGNVILEDGTTYIPLRAVGEAMGAGVLWDEATRSVFVSFTEDDAIAKIVEDVSPSVVAIVGNYCYSVEKSEEELQFETKVTVFQLCDILELPGEQQDRVLLALNPPSND